MTIRLSRGAAETTATAAAMTAVKNLIETMLRGLVTGNNEVPMANQLVFILEE